MCQENGAAQPGIDLVSSLKNLQENGKKRVVALKTTPTCFRR